MSLTNKLNVMASAEPTNYHEDTKKLLEQLASTTSELDNILIRQKDTILANLTKATKPVDFYQVIAQLEVVTELWKALNYEYKMTEILEKLHSKVSCYENKYGVINTRIVNEDTITS
jgi:hypothetical protein